MDSSEERRPFSNSEMRKKLRKPPEGHRMNPKAIRIHSPKVNTKTGSWSMSCPDALDLAEDVFAPGEDMKGEFAKSSTGVCRGWR